MSAIATASPTVAPTTHECLRAALVGATLTPGEDRLLRWLHHWDRWTVSTATGLLRKLRGQGGAAMTRGNILLVGLAVLAIVGIVVLALRELAPPKSTVEEQCADSPVKPACRALVRASGAPDLRPHDFGDVPLDAAPPLRPLIAGEEALRQGWPVAALRHCQEAAKVDGPDRPEALICAGRASLLLGWPARAVFYGERALDGTPLPGEEGAAYLLIGDGHRAAKDCRQARTAYLRALDAVPELEEARRGLEACGATPPPRPDLTDRDEGGPHALS